MPFSVDREFAFVHIPKTAGSSITQSLWNAGVPLLFDGSGLWDVLSGRDDAGEMVARLRRSFGIAELSTFPQHHLPAAMMRTLVGEERWKKAFTFTFVRNPWDLMVSSFLFFKQDVQRVAGSGHDVDRAELSRRCDTFERFVHFYPVMRSDCSEMLAGDEGECIVDFIGRYERLERDHRAVCERIGIQADLPHIMATEHTHYHDYYTPATQRAVARHFARDIERFEYTF